MLITRLLRLEFDHTKLEYYTELDAVLLVGTKKPIGSFDEVKSTVSAMLVEDDLTEEERQRISSLDKVLSSENGFCDLEENEVEPTSIQQTLNDVELTITLMTETEDRHHHCSSCNRPLRDLTRHIMELNIHSIPPQV